MKPVYSILKRLLAPIILRLSGAVLVAQARIILYIFNIRRSDNFDKVVKSVYFTGDNPGRK